MAGPRVSHGIGKALKRREVFPQRSHITVADHLPISALRQNSIDKKYIQTSISDRNLHRLAKSVRRRLQEVMLACSKLSEVITLDRLGSGQQKQQHLFLMPPVRIPVPAHESPGICFPVARDVQNLDPIRLDPFGHGVWTPIFGQIDNQVRFFVLPRHFNGPGGSAVGGPSVKTRVPSESLTFLSVLTGYEDEEVS